MFRAAGTGDVAAIGRLQDSAPGAAHWDPESYLASDCRVAVVGGQVAGFIAGRTVGPGESEILNLVVGLPYRRRRIARNLLEIWLRDHPGRCFLEVRESNRAARELYAKVGFRVAGRRPGYYSDPPEAAIVMAF